MKLPKTDFERSIAGLLYIANALIYLMVAVGAWGAFR